MIPKLKPKSVEKSVTLSVSRNGIAIDRHINALQDVLQHGTAGFIEAIDNLAITGDIDRPTAESVKRAADYADQMWQAYKRGKTNG